MFYLFIILIYYIALLCIILDKKLLDIILINLNFNLLSKFKKEMPRRNETLTNESTSF